MVSKRFLESLLDEREPAKRTRTVKTGAAAREVRRIAAKAAKQAIERNEEVKRHSYVGSNYISNAGASIINVYTLGYGLWPISPYNGYLSIAQGTGDGQRLGNKIKVKSAKLRIKMDPSAYNATYNPTPTPCMIIMWIFRMKQNNTLAGVQGMINGTFKDVNTTSQGLNGTESDLLLPENNNEIQLLHKKVFKLGHATNNGTGGAAGEQYKTNNDFKCVEYFEKDITKYLYGTYSFNDTNQTPDTQPVTWVLFEAISATGSYTDLGERPGQLHICAELNYTDA